jgi:hypothetical protein
MEGLAHEGHTDFGAGIGGALGVSGFPDGDLNFLEGLKHRDVVVAAAEQRNDLFREQGRQKIAWQDAALAKRLNVRPGLQAVGASRRNIKAGRGLGGIRHENTPRDQPRNRFGYSQFNRAPRSKRVGRADRLIGLGQKRSGIEQAVLQKGRHKLDDDPAEVLWRETENILRV